MIVEQQASVERARALVRGCGARVTLARIRVLARLLDAGCAMSHLDLLRELGTDGGAERLDRVTLYRVLDWLVDAGLAHRVAGPDRVYRFSVNRDGAAAHGHFRCTRCERTYCLGAGAALSGWIGRMLPGGFRGDEIDLTVSGCCARCAAA